MRITLHFLPRVVCNSAQMLTAQDACRYGTHSWRIGAVWSVWICKVLGSCSVESTTVRGHNYQEALRRLNSVSRSAWLPLSTAILFFVSIRPTLLMAFMHSRPQAYALKVKDFREGRTGQLVQRLHQILFDGL